LKVDTILIFEFVDADVERTECATPPDACTAVDQDGRAMGREVEPREVKLLSLARLSLPNREEKLKDMLAARRDTIVRPSYELVVNDSTLRALCGGGGVKIQNCEQYEGILTRRKGLYAHLPTLSLPRPKSRN
jgi:hypothetical protein